MEEKDRKKENINIKQISKRKGKIRMAISKRFILLENLNILIIILFTQQPLLTLRQQKFSSGVVSNCIPLRNTMVNRYAHNSTVILYLCRLMCYVVAALQDLISGNHACIKQAHFYDKFFKKLLYQDSIHCYC